MEKINKAKAACAALMLACSNNVNAIDGSNGPGVDNTIRPAGTKLHFMEYGGRMVTFHRGYLYIMGQGKTTLWDVSDATTPLLLSEKNLGDNGHRWWKLNTDMFWREYSMPEIAESGYHFMDMTNMLDIKPWTDTSAPIPIQETGQLHGKWQNLETFPTGTDGGNVHDSRYDDPSINPNALTSTFNNNNGGEGWLRFRIGNLMFTTTGNGLASFDIGDPENVKMLDVYNLPGFSQYTTTYHVWRDKVVFMNGNDANLNGNNLAMLDISDPTNLKPHTWPNGRTGLKTTEMSAGRYMYFQDEFGFAGQNDLAVKVNMETGDIVQKFIAPGWPETFLDYQWMPLGPVVVGTGSNGGNGRTFFYQHQDGADTRGPEIGFQNPSANSINNPVSTVLGFSIPEIIDERTANDTTIQVREIGSGINVEGHITWSSYHVLNFIPKTFLKPDTTYQVTFIENGLKDISGNGIKEYSYSFSTGSQLNADLAPVISALSADSPSPYNLGQIVQFTAVATDDGTDPLEYRWDTGAGNSAWGTANTLTHTFNSAGLHTVTVQVRDDKNNISSSSINVIVVEDQPPGPTSSSQKSGQMALDTLNKYLVVVNPDNDSLTVINSELLTVIGEYSACNGVSSVAIDNAQLAWVTCRDSDEIRIINTTTGVLVNTLSLSYGAKPQAIVANTSGDTLYVSLAGEGQVVSYASATQLEQARVDTGIHARAMAIDSTGDNLLVTQFISGDAGKVWKIDLTTFTLSHTIALANDTTTVDAGNQGGGLPNYLAGVAIEPTGASAIVVGKKDNTDRGTFLGTQPLTFEFTSRSNLSKLNLSDNTEAIADRIDIDNHAQPSSVTFSPLGTHIFVTMQGNNRLIVLSANDGNEVTRVDTGLAPQDVLIDPATNKVFVKNFLSRSISVFDGQQILTSGGISMPLIASVSTVTTDTMAANVLLGKQIFHNARDTKMTLEGYISCAGCHDDGAEDGRVWDFTSRGEGLRNTIALNGRAGTGHGRVHWTANFDEIHDFENDIRGAFGGTGFLTDAEFALTQNPLGQPKAGLSAELDALSAYQESLTEFGRSPHRQADGTLTSSAITGKQVFTDAGCGQCHSGADFTNSNNALLHDIGTLAVGSGKRLGAALQGIDTPTLKDLWQSAPYLHDGSAATLAALMSRPDNHGFSTLTSQQKSDLAAYLLQIDQSEVGSVADDIVLSLSATVTASDINLSITSNITGISQVDYLVDNVVVATSVAAPYSSVWSPAPGEYAIQAKVTHNGIKTTTDTTTVQLGSASQCQVNYKVSNVWNTGYGVEVTVTNLNTTPISGYDLVWSLPTREVFVSGWNASYNFVGGVFTASNLSSHWNGNLSAEGGSASFGFQMTKPVNNEPAIPTVISLNGTACTVTHL